MQRLDDRDIWVLRQLRAKIGEWDIGDRVQQNVTAHESVMILRAIDFALAAEEFLRAQERTARHQKPKQIGEVKQIGHDPDPD